MMSLQSAECDRRSSRGERTSPLREALLRVLQNRSEAELLSVLPPAELAAVLPTVKDWLAEQPVSPALIEAAMAAAAQRVELWETIGALAERVDISALPAAAQGAFLEGIAVCVDADARWDLYLRAAKNRPADAAFLWVGVRLAAERGDAQSYHELLTRAGRADPTAGNVRTVQRMRARLPSTEKQPVRVALLGSSTLDLVAAHLDLECRTHALRPEIYVAPFNAWARECIDPASGLRSFGPEAVVLAVQLDDLIPELAGPVTAAQLEIYGNDAVQHVRGAVGALREWSSAPLLLHDFDSVHEDPLGTAAARSDEARSTWLQRLNVTLRAALTDLSAVYVLDSVRIAARRSGGAADDPKMRHMASLRLTPSVSAEFARVYARHLVPLKGLTRKCVVVDLDNTMWGGVIGEDGIDGIRLGLTAPGSEFREFQSFLRNLSARGILLALCSKNNEADALEVIRQHPYMVLREDAFSAMRINWRPKPDNMIEIAHELNIGLDAMVFLDDNPNERELMRQALPEVLTPDLPADPALYRSLLESLPQLQVLRVTDEDRARAHMYQAQQQRASIRSQAATVEDYLASLDVQVTISVDEASALPRVHQLLQRTNQFNLTTRRHELGALQNWLEDDTWRMYTVRARDRFGDHGIAAVALVQRGGSRHRIDSFLMSCRVISYGIESALLSTIVADARREAGSVVVGEFIASAKNTPAGDFYARHGFRPADEHTWVLDAASSAPACPSWITVEQTHAS